MKGGHVHGSCMHVFVRCALYQANESGANGTEVIMWSVITL